MQASPPTIDSATIDATVAAISDDRTARSHASRPVHTPSADNGISFWHEGNQYAEERHGGSGSGDYFTDHKVPHRVRGVPTRAMIR